MESSYNLPSSVIEEMRREIRKHDKYQALVERKKLCTKQGQYALAMTVQKGIEDFEKDALKRCVEHYKKNIKSMVEVVTSMKPDDMNYMLERSYAVVMLSDVLDSVIRDMKRMTGLYYPEHKFNSYDKLLSVVKEAKDFIGLVNGLGNGDSYHINLYGDSVDNVTEMIINKARSFMNKINHHEKTVNKKAARVSEVA